MSYDYGTDKHKKEDRRKACIWITETMLGAYEMMQRADNRRDYKIAEALYNMALCLEFLLKDPELRRDVPK